VTPTEIKKTGSFSSGSRVEGRVKSFIEQERSEVLWARGSPGASYREHRTLSADDKDDIQKVQFETLFRLLIFLSFRFCRVVIKV